MRQGVVVSLALLGLLSFASATVGQGSGGEVRVPLEELLPRG